MWIGTPGDGWKTWDTVHARRHHPPRRAGERSARRYALDITVQYVEDRQQFDKPLGAVPGDRAPTGPRSPPSTALQNAGAGGRWARSDGRSVRQLAPMAKLFATQTFRDITDGQQVFGGVGFTVEYDIQLYFRRPAAPDLVVGHPVPRGAHRRRRAQQPRLAGPRHDDPRVRGRRRRPRVHRVPGWRRWSRLVLRHARRRGPPCRSVDRRRRGGGGAHSSSVAGLGSSPTVSCSR